MKPGDMHCDNGKKQLLLARGACIETSGSPKAAIYSCCSSQEEHVLKLFFERDFEVVHLVAPRKRSMY